MRFPAPPTTLRRACLSSRSAPACSGGTGVTEMEDVLMNKQSWVCGVVFLAGILLNAQDVSQVPPENLKVVVAKRSEQFVELLRRAEAGDEHAQYSVANAYSTGTGVPKDDAEAIRWWLQAAKERRGWGSESHGICVRVRIGSASELSRSCALFQQRGRAEAG